MSAWVTDGYTVENYIDSDVLEAAVREVHPTAERLADTSSTADPLASVVTSAGGTLKRVDKVAVALAVCARPANLDLLDLGDRVAELAAFIRETDLAPATATPVVAEVPADPE